MFKIADSVGNEGDVYQEAYILDTEAPAQTISAISFSDDSGTQDDFITNVATQDISATLSAGLGDTETLYASVDSGASWDDINDSISDSHKHRMERSHTANRHPRPDTPHRRHRRQQLQHHAKLHLRSNESQPKHQRHRQRSR